MRSSYLKKAAESKALTEQSMCDSVDAWSTRVSELALIMSGDKDVILLPFDNDSVLTIDVPRVTKAAKKFIKAVFDDSVEDTTLTAIDPYADGVKFVSRGLIGPQREKTNFSAPQWATRTTFKDVVMSAAIPYLGENKFDFPIDGADIGLMVIGGQKQSGKSVIANAVFQPDVRIRHGEPKEMWDAHPQAIRAARFTAALFGLLTFTAAGLLTSIDSMKNEAYRISGNPGPGGLQPTLLLILSDFALLASYSNAPSIVLVNPMGTEETMRLFIDQADSNVSSYVYMRQDPKTRKSFVAEAVIRKEGDRVDITEIVNKRLGAYFEKRETEATPEAEMGLPDGKGVNVIKFESLDLDGISHESASAGTVDTPTIPVAQRLDPLGEEGRQSGLTYDDDNDDTSPEVVTHLI